MRTAVEPAGGHERSPVFIERVLPLPLSELEVGEEKRDFHKQNLILAVYRDRGVTMDEDWPETAIGVSYYEMAGLALEALAPDREFDLVVFVTATPDCQIARFSGPRLNEILPGRPGFIGIGDHGVAGPFTALRLAANHLRHGLVDRVLVLVMEQALLPTVPDRLRTPRDSAVAMVVSRRSGYRIGNVAVGRKGTTASGPGHRPGSLLIQGANLQDLAALGLDRGFDETWKVEDEYACVGVWERFAADAGATAHEGFVLADSDPHLPYECVAELSRHSPSPEKEKAHVH